MSNKHGDGYVHQWYTSIQKQSIAAGKPSNQFWRADLSMEIRCDQPTITVIWHYPTTLLTMITPGPPFFGYPYIWGDEWTENPRDSLVGAVFFCCLTCSIHVLFSMRNVAHESHYSLMLGKAQQRHVAPPVLLGFFTANPVSLRWWWSRRDLSGNPRDCKANAFFRISASTWLVAEDHMRTIERSIHQDSRCIKIP